MTQKSPSRHHRKGATVKQTSSRGATQDNAGMHHISFTARHSSSGRQPNCGVEQTAPPVFGRAAITLGIGPHSSFSRCIEHNVV